MSRRQTISPDVLAKYVVMKFDDADRPIDETFLNDILYAFQLCHIRHSGNLLFQDEFYASEDGPTVVRLDRGYNSVLIHSVVNNSPVRDIVVSWVESVQREDPRRLHRIATNEFSPWRKSYVEGKSVRMGNDLLFDYALADKRVLTVIGDSSPAVDVTSDTVVSVGATVPSDNPNGKPRKRQRTRRAKRPRNEGQGRRSTRGNDDSEVRMDDYEFGDYRWSVKG